MKRTPALVVLALITAATFTWATVVAVRAGASVGFDPVLSSCGAVLFMLAAQVGFSWWIELKGTRVLALATGLVFWTLYLMPVAFDGFLGIWICGPGMEAMRPAFRCALVLPALLVVKYVLVSNRSASPGPDGIPSPKCAEVLARSR